jgi:hypothetical protein
MKKFLVTVAFLQIFLCSFGVNKVTVKGVVKSSDGKSIAGVVVNDGTLFTTTSSDGTYTLSSNLERAKFVSISIPANYEIGTKHQLANSFYYRLKKDKEINTCNFTLVPRRNTSSKFTYIAISDPQVKNDKQLDRFVKESVPDIKHTTDSLKGYPIIGMSLGDLVWDAMDLYDGYKVAVSNLGMTMFQCIGNHDFNKLYNALSNTPDDDAPYAEEEYYNTFGPTDYSFNRGKVHIVTMKDIDYHSGRVYKEQLTPEQLIWLKNDLSYVPVGSTVFLNMHAPIYNKSAKGAANVRNASQLIEILKPYKVHLFEGHTHYYENEEIAPNIYEHNIGAVCGAWWAGNVCTDGAPNGYLVVNVDNDHIMWHYKAVNCSPAYQFRLYRLGEFESEKDYVVANVWDWDSAWKVQWYQDGVLQGNMEQHPDEDQDFITMKKGQKTGYHTLHLFRAKPSPGARAIKVVVTNRFGETYAQELTLH